MTGAKSLRSSPAVRAMETLLAKPAAREIIERSFPDDRYRYGRMLGEVLDLTERKPEIADCQPASIVRAIARAVSWNLVIGDTALLFPRRAQEGHRGRPMLMAWQAARGKIELMMRFNVAKVIDAQPLYANEPYEYEQGTKPFIKHLPIVKPEERGSLIATYAWARLSWAGDPKIVMLPASEIDKIRREWSTECSEGSLDEHPGYAVSKAVHALSKQIPMPTRVQSLLTDDANDREWDEAASFIEPGSAAEKQLLVGGTR